MEQIIVGIILFAFGGFSVIRPDVFLRFQIWVQKTVMGAEYVPSNRTYKIVRIFGIVLVVLGLLNLVGRI